jgi:hypothetical protein
MPGYTKNVGDHIRMRWVQPGYDPDSTTVPPNRVIFDSDDIGAMSILAFGAVTVPSGNQSTYVQLVTWNLDYVPLCWLQWDEGDGYAHSACSGASPSLGPYRVNIRKTGIWYRGWVNAGFTLIYTAFREKAADG